MTTLTHWLAIAAGGALGAVGRAAIGVWISHELPFATLVVNLVGSLLIGFFLGWELAGGLSPSARLFLAVGFCGAFTTFSTFSYQTLALLEQGRLLWALGNIVVSLLGCLMATWLGLRLANALLLR